MNDAMLALFVVTVCSSVFLLHSSRAQQYISCACFPKPATPLPSIPSEGLPGPRRGPCAGRWPPCWIPLWLCRVPGRDPCSTGSTGNHLHGCSKHLAWWRENTPNSHRCHPAEDKEEGLLTRQQDCSRAEVWNGLHPAPDGLREPGQWRAGGSQGWQPQPGQMATGQPQNRTVIQTQIQNRQLYGLALPRMERCSPGWDEPSCLVPSHPIPALAGCVSTCVTVTCWLKHTS